MYSKRMGDESQRLHKSEKKFKVPYKHNLPLNFEDGSISYVRPYRITRSGNYVVGYSAIDDELCGSLTIRGDKSMNGCNRELTGHLQYSGKLHKLFDEYEKDVKKNKFYRCAGEKNTEYNIPVVKEIEFSQDELAPENNDIYDKNKFEKSDGESILEKITSQLLGFPDENLVELKSSIMVKQNFFPKTKTTQRKTTNVKYVFKYDHCSDNCTYENDINPLDKFNEKGTIELIAEINLDKYTRLSHIGIVGELPKYDSRKNCTDSHCSSKWGSGVIGRSSYCQQLKNCSPKFIKIVDVGNTGYVTEFDLYVFVNNKWQFMKTYEGNLEPFNIKLIPFTYDQQESPIIKIKIVPTKYVVRPMMRLNFYGTSEQGQIIKSKDISQKETLIGTSVKYTVVKTITASHEKLKPRGCSIKCGCNKMYKIHPNRIRSQEQKRTYKQLIEDGIDEAWSHGEALDYCQFPSDDEYYQESLINNSDDDTYCNNSEDEYYDSYE